MTAEILWELTGRENKGIGPVVPPLVAWNRSGEPVRVDLEVYVGPKALGGARRMWVVRRDLPPHGWGLWLGGDWYQERQVETICVTGPACVEIRTRLEQQRDGTWKAYK